MLADKKMATGRLRLKGGVFDRKQVNSYKLSQIGQISYPTVLKYIKADNVDMFSGEVLYTMLSVGLGLSDAEIADLRIGDLFEVKDVSE